MPWEKSFDIDHAVKRAMNVFWLKGYEATSMSDLTEEMQINKGSLYNAFGSKKQLFTRALLKFETENRQHRLAKLEAIDDPKRAITLLFEGLISESAADSACKGCFLVNTALELPSHDEDVRTLVVEALDDFETFFKRLIVRGHRQGTIPKNVKAGQTAKSLLSLAIGLRVLARGACEASALHAIKRDAVRLISSPSAGLD